jgi:hypothetical protein
VRSVSIRRSAEKMRPRPVELVELRHQGLEGEIPTPQGHASGQRHDHHHQADRQHHPDELLTQEGESLSHAGGIGNGLRIEAQAGGEQGPQRGGEARRHDDHQAHRRHDRREMTQVPRARDLTLLPRLLQLARTGG